VFRGGAVPHVAVLPSDLFHVLVTSGSHCLPPCCFVTSPLAQAPLLAQLLLAAKVA
jgi:hypothetical protein